MAKKGKKFRPGQTPKSSGDSVATHKGMANLKPWTKGQSGNPAGKPAGTLNRKTIIEFWLSHDATDGGGGTRLDQIIRAQVQKAETGDATAFNALMDSVFGKLADIHEHGGIGGGAIKTDNTNTITAMTPEERLAELERRGLPTEIFEK